MTKKKYLSKKRKTLIALLCAVSVTCTGLAAACAQNEESTSPDNPSTPTPEDTQLLKNGNFEFFNVPDDAQYLIKSVDDWSRSGDSSALSGIISTSPSAWEKFEDEDLKTKLDANNELKRDDPDYDDLYVDYNGMKSQDILYRESYGATLEHDDVAGDEIIARHGLMYLYGIAGDDASGYYLDDNGNGVKDDGEISVYKSPDDAEDIDFYFDEDCTKTVRERIIENPGTHYEVLEKPDGSLYFTDGEKETEVLVNDAGDYYYVEKDEDDNSTDVGISNVLMVHNYVKDTKYNGLEQHYASQSITLEANTAAELSLWVKTSDLKFDKGYSMLDDQDRGAYIEVKQSVGGHSIDDFRIQAINTEKIIKDNPGLENESNGWLKYTIYINACDFADSTITLNLGLGSADTRKNKCTGYAFFDDVEIKKYLDLEEGTFDEAMRSKIESDETFCSLATEEDGKIFIADREIRVSNGAADATALRHSQHFDYLINLASAGNLGAEDEAYSALPFTGNSSVKITAQKDGKKLYAPVLTNDAKLSGITLGSYTDGSPVLPDNFEEIITKNDLIGIFDGAKTFSVSDFNSYAPGEKPAFKNPVSSLNSALTGDKGINALENFGNVSDMIMMFSAYGAPYTATVDNSTAFTVGTDADGYRIISFWVKTSDMSGSSAATIKIYNAADEEKSASISVDSTNRTTDVGENKDIYSGWVQCFFFIHNETDTEETFKIDFSFGNTSISGTSNSAYEPGWAAMANMQSLKITEDVFGYVPSGSYSQTFTFDDDKTEAEHNKFDEASGNSDIKLGIAKPENYEGVNGASNYIVKNDETEIDFNKKNPSDAIAGLISKEDFDGYDSELKTQILSAFTTSTATWAEAFGDDCYQPLIIVNNLRTYNEKQVVNYGFIGENKTISANAYEPVSVRVKVSGNAVAYIYLVDTSTRKVMDFSTPRYTFFYDTEGNVLDKEYDEDMTENEHRDAIVYTLRDDGLYEDGEGKIFANLYNLTKSYKYYQFENNTFYDKNGDPVSYDELEDGEDYYSDATCEHLSSHYLVADGTRVYEYDGAAQKYYYMVNGKRGVEVNNFDESYVRYPINEAFNAEYSVKVENTDGKWVTVSFYIYTGDSSKEYRLELWSGKRDETGASENLEGAVAFDYVQTGITESNYTQIRDEQEQLIIEEYKNILRAKNKISVLPKNDVNIDYFEETLVNDGVLTQEEVDGVKAKFGNYVAEYYTYTLYDSNEYIPFNRKTAKNGETGYDYTITDFSEELAYFSYFDDESNSYNTFVNYSTVDKQIEINTIDDEEEPSEEDNQSNAGEAWLLISSIILVVVLVFVMLALLARDIMKKARKKRGMKSQQNNNYKKRERYIRKLGLIKNEEEPEEPAETVSEPDGPEKADEPVETEVPDEPAETPAEAEVPEKADEAPTDAEPDGTDKTE